MGVLWPALFLFSSLWLTSAATTIPPIAITSPNNTHTAKDNNTHVLPTSESSTSVAGTTASSTRTTDSSIPTHSQHSDTYSTTTDYISASTETAQTSGPSSTRATAATRSTPYTTSNPSTVPGSGTPQTATTSAKTVPTNASSTSTSITEAHNETVTPSTGGSSAGLGDSERAITIFFGVVLGVLLLGVFMYALSTCKRRRTQFSHEPLYNTSDDTVDQFSPGDDTLIISGGLYDGPQIYNPSINEELHSHHIPFDSRPTQFRLEFLREDEETARSNGHSTFQSFKSIEDH
ncbi:integumentary mucin C.1-like [Denticeps clupeoides]|uniref:Uncharacterized protein n=1 Tax=Denticeps clupeoides TaxID=299321 RepID=A0A8C4G9A9_9TELE|nr:integumentary mucin C.1-like [Denticeps clupeoides]XP_028854862.1 integumentary mucin C.1-like [Denticeps clupeoides]